MNAPRFVKILLWAHMLSIPVMVSAEVTPLWTRNFGVIPQAAVLRGNYYNNTTLFGGVVQITDTFDINFDWGTGSPGGVAANQFSARFSGSVMPATSGNFTFHAVADDGVRVWLEDQLIIDRWIDQGPTEWPSVPMFLQAGSLYRIRVESYENTGGATLRLFWSSPNLAKQLVTFRSNPDGTGASFGGSLAGLGGGRVAVGAPAHEVLLNRNQNTYVRDGGFAWYYEDTGSTTVFPAAPITALRRNYGMAMAAFGDGRLLVSASDLINVGVVYLHGSAGELLGTWPNPDGPPDAYFGHTLTTLPGNRFAASSLTHPNKVFLFDATAQAAPSATILNPAPGGGLTGGTLVHPWSGSFGSALAVLGNNRLLVGYPNHSVDNDKAGSVFVYDLTGNPLRTVHNPFPRQDGFGTAITIVDERRFLVGAPMADVQDLESPLITRIDAGVVYLYDDTFTRIRTFEPPNPATAVNFGSSITMLGPDRFLVGSTKETVAGIPESGSVHLFTLDGVALDSVGNPAPGTGDRFGATVAAIDDQRFVIGAPGDDTVRPDAGSIYAFDAPIGTLELGMEIAPPPNVNVDAPFPTQGPTVTPAGAAFWHVQSGKLFAVKPGSVIVSWPLNGGGKSNWQGVFGWPAGEARFQVHVAGPTSVNLNQGGAFPNVTLHATTTNANPTTVGSSQRFTATTPGLTLLMLSAGPPASSPIRFQLVRTVAWNDAAHLHNNATATIGLPIIDPGPYHDPSCGAPQTLLPGGIFCPAPVYDPATRTGTIIPVNLDNPAKSTDDLVVAYFQPGAKLYDPVTGANVVNAICWPYKPVRFAPKWPSNPPKVVIASQQGTGAIDPSLFVDWELYVENDSAKPGFNPNDEHALRLPSGAAEGVFALRDDLGTAATSEPHVLIRYRDPAQGMAWRMKVWRVMAEEAPFFFRYPARAGLLIQAPFPLSILDAAPQSVGVSGPFWRDRKLSYWAKAGGDDGGVAEIVMRYFYPVQPGFFFPGANPPALGSNVPLLDLRAGSPGIPINVRYDTVWPENVPELRIGETLVKPKNGLPQIAGQTSAEIIYDQAVAHNEPACALLIDPVRTRSVPLAQLPTDVETRVKAGLLHFPALPPHLENRVRYDPALLQLQLVGEFVEPPAGESYSLLNVLTPREKAIVRGLSTSSPFLNAVENLATAAANVVPVPPDSPGFDSLALTAGNGASTGYLTLAFANSTLLSAPSEPISLNVIKVSCPLYRGELKVIESPNPLAEQLTLRHSGDFFGRPDDFEFEWRTLPPVDGLPSTQPPAQWIFFQPKPATGIGAVDITISGPGLYTLSDNYFVCRYRRLGGAGPCGSDWSAWTAPMLAEGWIKRVLAGIGPFEQRIKDYQDTEVNTIVSMISQAGARAVGDIALNLNAVNESGLVEVYETVLRRGMNLSIDGAPPVDYPPANDALLLAAGRLADLYMLLGNEAYADAADPTIGFGTDDGIYGSQATSIHCFMNQTASLLEEELTLLRGRDNSKQPSIQTHPIYNRLIWNFTRDITGGEVAYALNYNLRNVNGDVGGVIDEADAKQLYPQGHGDAWGHYLTAIKNYYRLLRNPQFTWVPRIEAVLVGGVPVSVDFLDERKFAAAAAARARAGAELVNLTFRDAYEENPAKPWQNQTDTDANRAWSLSDWSSRAGQGAFFDWVAGNAILPDVDNNPAHTGIQKIDRTTVRELHEIAEAFREIQEFQDEADTGRNPLGLASNVVPFDLDPSAVAAGKTHFEQINDRANEALKNAVAVFDHANASTQLLRRQADDANGFQQRVTDGEADFNNRLIEIFGTPYPDDIGPTGTYATGYAGPDIYHYDYVDRSEIQASASLQQPTLRFQLTELNVMDTDGGLRTSNVPVTFHFSPNGFGLAKPSSWVGQRRAPGEIQLARSALLESVRRLERGVEEYENLISEVKDAAELLRAEVNLNTSTLSIRKKQQMDLFKLDLEIISLQENAHALRFAAHQGAIMSDFVADGLPEVVGLATDALSVTAAMLRMLGRQAKLMTEFSAATNDLDAQHLQVTKNGVAALAEIELATIQASFGQKERLQRLEQLIRAEPSARLELAAQAESQRQAAGRYQAALARGLRLLEERTRFRQQTAAQIQTYRYKDMAFRIFRSDALQKYRAQFDLAARYAYLAAKAYDYETCLAPGDNRGPGDAFLRSIIRSRSLGRFSGSTPLPAGGTGDPGLSDPLARMTSNWNLVLKGQLGFNNPQTETGRFSLRNELFRVLTGPAGSQRWRETLDQYVVPDLLSMPEFQRHCIPFSPTQASEPAIVIPFATTINFGLNFFGWPAGGGDNDYDSTKFATKVRSVGVWFANYNNLGGGMINTPRVYLFPVGLDVMRAPTQGNPYVREWRILDQALPVPFPLSPVSLNDRNWIPITDTLNEDFASIRKFGRFRAFHDSGNFNPAEAITDSRLIGRSVWNTRWLLIIPAGTLHTDRTEGIQRFIHGALQNDGTRDGNGVSDIKIFFQTYAYSGN